LAVASHKVEAQAASAIHMAAPGVLPPACGAACARLATAANTASSTNTKYAPDHHSSCCCCGQSGSMATG